MNDVREVTERKDFDEYAQSIANELGKSVTAYPKEGEPYEVYPEDSD